MNYFKILNDLQNKNNCKRIAELAILAKKKKIGNQLYDVDKKIIRYCKKDQYDQLIKMMIEDWIMDPDVMPKNFDEAIQLLEMRINWMK